MSYKSTVPADNSSPVAADIRENFRALKEDDIVEGVAALGIVEGMIAAGAVTVNKLGASAVSQAKLKTSQGSVTGTQANLTLPGGEYGFYPQLKNIQTYVACTAQLASAKDSNSYITNIFMGAYGGFAQQRYVTSSGEVFWVFILRDKITKDVISMYQAPDHPCFGNGGKPALVSHPFGNYDPTKHEIVVINPSKDEILEVREKAITDDVIVSYDKLTGFNPDDYVEFEQGDGQLWTMKQSEVITLKKEKDIHSDVRFNVVRPDRDILEVIRDEHVFTDYNVWPETEVTVGLPRRVKVGESEIPLEEVPLGTKITPYKRRIPYRPGMVVQKLEKK